MDSLAARLSALGRRGKREMGRSAASVRATVRVHLTDDGLERLQAMRSARTALLEQRLKRFTEPERAALATALPLPRCFGASVELHNQEWWNSTLGTVVAGSAIGAVERDRHASSRHGTITDHARTVNRRRFPRAGQFSARARHAFADVRPYRQAAHRGILAIEANEEA